MSTIHTTVPADNDGFRRSSPNPQHASPQRSTTVVIATNNHYGDSKPTDSSNQNVLETTLVENVKTSTRENEINKEE